MFLIYFTPICSGMSLLFLTKNYILLLNYLHLCLFNIDRLCSINNIHVCSVILSCTSADTKYNVWLFFILQWNYYQYLVQKKQKKGGKKNNMRAFSWNHTCFLTTNHNHIYTIVYIILDGFNEFELTSVQGITSSHQQR